MGYAALLSARPGEGELERWQTGDPAGKGSFIHVVAPGAYPAASPLPAHAGGLGRRF
jgi:hypothetical protein